MVTLNAITFWPPDFWPSFLRALVLAVLSVGLQRLLLPALAQCRLQGIRRVILWGAIAMPFLSPPLLTAYAYTVPFLQLARHPWLEENCYSFLVFLRFFPLSLLAGHLLPRRLSPEAVHCRALTMGRTRRSWHFYWRNRDPVTLVSAMLVFLFAFHEFEMASLLQRPAWTVAVFDAQAQGYALGDTWSRLWLIALLQVLGVFTLLRLIARQDGETNSDRMGEVSEIRLYVYVGIAVLLTAIVPIAIIGKNALQGIASLPETFSMQREVGQSLSVAFVSSVFGYLLAFRLVQVGFRLWTSLLLLPGLLGTLLLSLSILGVSQWSALAPWRDRPLFLIVALVFSLLPILTLLVALAKRRDHSDSSWTARLMGRRELFWSYTRGPHLGVWSVGFILAYFEVTTSAILAPASMTPVMVRLYNLMHYGRDTMLSAYVLVVVAVPLSIVALATALGYGLSSRRG